MSKVEENGFVRMIFWALIIGSFGWTTFVGYSIAQTFGAHCKESAATFVAVKSEMVQRDETMEKEFGKDLREISVSLAEIKATLKVIQKDGRKE